jgi:sialidase-1
MVVSIAFAGICQAAETGGALPGWELSSGITLDEGQTFSVPHPIAYGDYEVSLTVRADQPATTQLELWVGAEAFLIDGIAGKLTCYSTQGNWTYLDDPLKTTLPSLLTEKEFSISITRHAGQVTILWNGMFIYEAEYKRDTVGRVQLCMRTGRGSVESLDVKGLLLDVPEQADLFVKGQDGYAYYRIPALVRMPGGALLAFAEARHDSYHDTGNIDLVVRRSLDDGATWEPTKLIYEEGGEKPIACVNLSPVVDRETGRLWIFFIVCEHFNKGEFKLMRMFSDDDGATWSTPEDVRAALCNPDWLSVHPGPGHGIQLARGAHAGRLMVPGWHYMDGGMGVFTFYSDDHGATWSCCESVAKGPNESMLVEQGNGDVMMMMRQPHRSGSLWRLYTTSRDGVTWDPVRSIQDFRTSECMASVLDYSSAVSGRAMLFCQPGAGNFSHPKVNRAGLTLRTSLDDGLTWPVVELVYPGLSAYSDMTLLEDGQVGLLFENGDLDVYERISFLTWSPLAGTISGE